MPATSDTSTRSSATRGAVTVSACRRMPLAMRRRRSSGRRGATSRAISEGRPGSATSTNRRFLPFVSASGCLMHSRPAAG
ncbi:hypothetical protein AQJ27_36045 [Streptomyces olivochromogenes]|nr:hypothetical protein AQJ27_36045 [Streptomyces olivochromogenes]